MTKKQTMQQAIYLLRGLFVCLLSKTTWLTID